jgi:serine/threonine protein kinase
MEPASPLDSIPRDPSERRVGSYRLLKKIGQGGMGVVHEAQRGDEPPVALKMLRERPEDPDAIRRFHREARALMAIDSLHVVRVLDEGDADGLP